MVFRAEGLTIVGSHMGSKLRVATVESEQAARHISAMLNDSIENGHWSQDERDALGRRITDEGDSSGNSRIRS